MRRLAATKPLTVSGRVNMPCGQYSYASEMLPFAPSHSALLRCWPAANPRESELHGAQHQRKPEQSNDQTQTVRQCPCTHNAVSEPVSQSSNEPHGCLGGESYRLQLAPRLTRQLHSPDCPRPRESVQARRVPLSADSATESNMRSIRQRLVRRRATHRAQLFREGRSCPKA